MTVVSVCTAGGTTGSTTTALLLAAMVPAGHTALMAECDPSGGDVAAWASLPTEPGWATAISGSDRTLAAVKAHAQVLPSVGLRLMTSPSRAFDARPVVAEAARGFVDLLVSWPDVLTVADCGRVSTEPSPWLTRSALVRQGTAHATAARVDRCGEMLEYLRPLCRQIGVVLVGTAPYPAHDIERALGVPLVGHLPEDQAGAELVAGAWTVGRRSASRSALARGAAELAERVFEVLYGRDWRTARATATIPPPATAVAGELSRVVATTDGGVR
jgi:hypothetical protein